MSIPIPIPTQLLQQSGFFVGLGRFFLALLGGSVATLTIHMMGLALLGWLFPMPPGTDPTNADSMEIAIAAMPTAAFVGLWLSYFVSTTAGAAIATVVSARSLGWSLAGPLAIGVLYTVGAILNLSAIPHPTLFVAANLPEFMVAAFIGWRFAHR